MLNRDILIGSIAAAIGMNDHVPGSFALFFGGGDDNRGGGFGVLAAWILASIDGGHHPDGGLALA